MSSEVDTDLIRSSTKASFADVAHQILTFDSSNASDRLVLQLVDCRWVQRLRDIRQTGNTNLVYMFSEHSRFGHSLGVAYLASLLMQHLSSKHEEMVAPYRNAVAAAALLHDIGHVAPGSHLAERVWQPNPSDKHEQLTVRIIENDPQIRTVLDLYNDNLTQTVIDILNGKNTVPEWTKAIISGGGWNADRGNWAIVDSAMCSVTYGRYNVGALIDAFRLTADGQLALQENRLDALTHFFLARDSMYRQVYQHRVLQSTDKLTELIVVRLHDICGSETNSGALLDRLRSLSIFCDDPMLKVLNAKHYAQTLDLEAVYHMTESWWSYHVTQWGQSKDPVLSDLALRLKQRRLFKTIRLTPENGSDSEQARQENESLVAEASRIAKVEGFDPRYYVSVIGNRDKHRTKVEELPPAILDNGELAELTDVEPLVKTLLANSGSDRKWLAVPEIVKDRLGRVR
jgi:hypothetical protein